MLAAAESSSKRSCTSTAYLPQAQHSFATDAFGLRYEACAKMVESPVVVIAHRAVRLSGLFRYFSQGQALKNDSLYRSSLAFVQSGEQLLDELFQFGNRHAPSVMRICFPFHDLFEIGPVVELSQCQIISPVNAPMIGELQEPHFKSASASVKSSLRSVHFEENILRDFLGLPGVVEDSQRNRQNQTMMAIKERGKRVAIPLLNLTYQLLVGRLPWRLGIGK